MKPQVLKGFRDYLPADMLARKALIREVERVFELHGFSPLDTPALEYAELLLGKYGDEGDKLLFRFLDNGERDVALRYDLTVPLARVLGANPEILLPFKRYHIAPVWRAEKPARGRFREFMQCDVDIVGVADMSADAEVIATGIRALEAVMVRARASAEPAAAPRRVSFRVRLSNRKLLTGLVAKLGIAEGDAFALFRTIDKLEKQGEAAVRELLAKDCGFGAAQIDHTFAFLRLTNPAAAPSTDLTAIEKYFAGVEIGEAGVRELAQVIAHLREQGLEGKLALDVSIARGLDYYTGSVYETFIDDLPGFGSVMSGGRYDRLLDMFTGRQTPAVGISVGLDRLLSALVELGLAQSRPSPTEALVTVFSPELRGHASALAQRLRDAGVSAELYLGDDKLKKQFQYANRQAAALVVICGPDERQSGTVKIKALATGAEHTVGEGALAETARRLLAEH